MKSKEQVVRDTALGVLKHAQSTLHFRVLAFRVSVFHGFQDETVSLEEVKTAFWTLVDQRRAEFTLERQIALGRFAHSEIAPIDAYGALTPTERIIAEAMEQHQWFVHHGAELIKRISAALQRKEMRGES